MFYGGDGETRTLTGCPIRTSNERVYHSATSPQNYSFNQLLLRPYLQVAFAFADRKMTISYKSLYLSNPNSCQRSEFDYGSLGKEIGDFLADCHIVDR